MTVAQGTELSLTGDLYKAIVTIIDERVREIRVTREDFDALTGAVKDLAAAQVRTEALLESLAAKVEQLAQAQVQMQQRLDSLSMKVEQLAEAQARTEARLEELAAAQARTEKRLEEVAAAQAKTEARLDSLTAKVEQLAEAQARTEARLEELAAAQARTEARLEELAAAQARTEARLEELAAAQARTEKRLEELAAAQAKTEKVVRGLVVDMREVKKQLGGLSNTVGYGLEDRAIRALPAILKDRMGLDVGVMDRRFLEYPDGKDDEINIYGEGVLDGEPVVVVGESKAHLGPKDVDRFKKMLERVHTHVGRRLVPLLVVYSVRPKVEEYARRCVPGLLLFKSYEF